MSVGLAAALVAAAISLKAPLQDAATRFQAAVPGEAITFTFGSSGQLAAQIEHRAPVDLFVGASPVDMDRLADAGMIDRSTRTTIAGNRLVGVVRRGLAPAEDLAGLAAPRFARIAIGNPRTVPVGRYARESIVTAGIVQAVSPRFVYAENARQLVELVVRGEVDAALVYATDVRLGGDALVVAFEIPGSLHAPIVYEAAVVVGATSPERARAFVEFLASAAGRETLVESGFAPPRTLASK